MNDGLLGVVVAVATGLTFVAYYHPDKYRYLAGTLLAGLVALIIYAMVRSHFEEIYVAAIMASTLGDEQKELAVRAMKGLDRPNKNVDVKVVLSCLYLYATVLGTLPWLGLTVFDRDHPGPRGRW